MSEKLISNDNIMIKSNLELNQTESNRIDKFNLESRKDVETVIARKATKTNR